MPYHSYYQVVRLCVVIVVIKKEEISWFFSNFSTKPQFLYEGAIFLRKFNIKN